jgi:hypothetical protein
MKSDVHILDGYIEADYPNLENGYWVDICTDCQRVILEDKDIEIDISDEFNNFIEAIEKKIEGSL